MGCSELSVRFSLSFSEKLQILCLAKKWFLREAWELFAGATEELRNTDHKKCWKSSRLTFWGSEKNASRCELTHNAVKFNFRQIGKAREWCSLEAARVCWDGNCSFRKWWAFRWREMCGRWRERESCAEGGKLWWLFQLSAARWFMTGSELPELVTNFTLIRF